MQTNQSAIPTIKAKDIIGYQNVAVVTASNGFCVRVGWVDRFRLEEHVAQMASSLKRSLDDPKENRCPIESDYTHLRALL